MSDLNVSMLAGYAQKFNQVAGQKLQELELIPAAQAALEAAQSTFEAIQQAAPEPSDEVKAAAALLADADEKAQLAQMKAMFGDNVEIIEALAGPEAVEALKNFDESSFPSDEALENAEAVLDAFEEASLPTILKYEEAVAGVLTGVLADAANDIVPDDVRNQDLADAFTANNAPALAAAFAPKP